MRKLTVTLLLLATAIAFQFCATSKSTATKPPATSFDSNVKPLIQASCAPCHIAGKGNKKSLDNYVNAKELADDIITRIQKNPGEHGFMPMRNTKLSDSAVAVFVQWKKDGLPEL